MTPTARAHAASASPPVVDRVYDLWIWLGHRHVDLPAHARATIGRRILDTMLDLLDLTLQAMYEPRHAPAFDDVLKRGNHRVALLRYLLRGALDQRYLAPKQHAYAIERLDEVGRMLGAWRRSARRDDA